MITILIHVIKEKLVISKDRIDFFLLSLKYLEKMEVVKPITTTGK